jgi:hypothetical protein
MKKYKFITRKVFDDILDKLLNEHTSKLRTALFYNPSLKDELLSQRQLRQVCERLIQGLVDQVELDIEKENK